MSGLKSTMRLAAAGKALLPAALLAAGLAVWAPGPAVADKDDYEYERKSGDCKYKYKENKHGYKEEYKCKGKPFDRPKYKYESKEGGCKYKYEESSSGYKEEYKCKKGRNRRLAGQGYWPKSMKRGPQAARGAPFDIDLGVCNRELLGQALGGAVGGLLGAKAGEGSGQAAAVAAGTFLGLLLGGELGRYMDEVDRRCAGQVLEHGRDDQTIVWQNPENGARYDFTPSGSFSDARGRYCREYQSTAVVGGQARQTYGTACRQPDGAWQLVN